MFALKPSESSPEFSKWQDLMNEVRGFSKLIIAKNRDGEIGDLNFKFSGEFSRFTETNFFIEELEKMAFIEVG